MKVKRIEARDAYDGLGGVSINVWREFPDRVGRIDRYDPNHTSIKKSPFGNVPLGVNLSEEESGIDIYV